MAGKGGGAWKVAYADFVTAMMAFFMVMWLTSQSDDLRKAVAEHFRNPGGKRFAGSDAKSLISNNSIGAGSRRAVKAKGSKKSEPESTSRKMTDEGERSNIGKILPFDLNSDALTDPAKRELNELLPELEGNQFRIEIRGHTAPSGSKSLQANLDACTISYKRSLAVMEYLIGKGIDPHRIRLSQAGSSEPLISDDESQRQSDSRVEVFMLKELHESAESKVQRLVNTKALDEEASVLAEKDKAAAAAASKSDEAKH
ncbi:MAG: flagellar motor protein MotB [Planctomycetota bacterium]|jgi:chemotaxis protein MotB